MNIRKLVTVAVMGVCVAGAAGCKTVRQTEPPRTATEELLVTAAAERALTNVDFSWLKGRHVYLEDKYLESYDRGYVLGLLRQRFSVQGVLLEPTNTHADVIVEVRSAALSINNSTTLFGIPSTASPVPLAGAIQLPEVALYKSEKDDSIAKLELFAYERESGNYIRTGEPMIAAAYYHQYKLLFFGWKTSDVPLLKHPPKG